MIIIHIVRANKFIMVKDDVDFTRAQDYIKRKKILFLLLLSFTITLYIFIIIHYYYKCLK
jgi:hypothetical protein